MEIQVSKGLTKQLGDKDWERVEYTVKAKLDSPEEVNVAKAQLEATIDSWLQQAFQQKQQPAKEAKPALDTEHAEVYEKLNWEDRTGSKGSFQMLRRDNCNDLQLYNHLENMLKQNRGNLGLGNFHYWLGQEGFIFRRVKKPKL
jgi:hypothetical protein